SKRFKNSRVVVRQVIKNMLVGALICAIGWGVISKLARSVGLLRDQLRESRRLSAELKSLKAENKELQRRLKYIRTPHGAAEAARKLGYVRPGEVLLVLPPDFAFSDGDRSGGR
ncbi:MAG: FtsB family cell division protein, partial [Armatimonadota bacterium]